jgi:hypothetical protein
MKPQKPTSLAPDRKDLNPRIVQILQRLEEVSGGRDAQKAQGGGAIPPRTTSAYGTLSYRPLSFDTFGVSKSRENGVAKKARSVGRFVGHAAASAVLGELFRAARRRT